MTAQLLAFPRPAPPPKGAGDNLQALLTAVVELHALITIDPTLGATPVRVYFVFNPDAKARIAACLSPTESHPAPTPLAYALVAYDFAFALHLIDAGSRPIASDRAAVIATASAELQGGALRAAAAALGVEARPIRGFDPAGLKACFFPTTQETVTHLFQLEL
jgi:3-hydroxypropanoate dehydrogenase